MKGLGIEVRTVWPHQSVRFRIEGDLIEQDQVAERSIQLPSQNRLKVDNLLGSVVKTDAQRVRRDDFKIQNPANQMRHTFILLQWRDRRGLASSTQ